MMDSLHGMLRTLSSEYGVKSGNADKRTPHHLDVFREFLSHLEKAKRQHAPRPKAIRKAGRAAKR